ncbi:hypothetical protein POM88_001673 [Heracleum sosnowskyi]|uniref:Uncharacterized protein n=1 Tax=Heracleum sosnowskyi TaxID=360622 RepID=A0AAD8JE01_9APIA|nr:hypothetical protein POM88_001673 [Heracleum sosnowskyi]
MYNQKFMIVHFCQLSSGGASCQICLNVTENKMDLYGALQGLLGIQRATKCLTEQCMKTQTCGPKILACQNNIFYGGRRLVTDNTRLLWGENKEARSLCLIADHDKFGYGAYKWTFQLVTNESRLEKILFPIFWGLMTLSTFGNLESTTDWLEVVFIIIVLTSGLLLVTMLIDTSTSIHMYVHGVHQIKNNSKWNEKHGVVDDHSIIFLAHNGPTGLGSDF